MTDREELRRRLVLEGHDPETIDAVLAWYYEKAAGTDALEELLDWLRVEMAGAFQSMAEAWEQLTGGVAAQPLPQQPKLPRPPRCTGPKNKAATRAQRPARVARSSCRKMRR